MKIIAFRERNAIESFISGERLSGARVHAFFRVRRRESARRACNHFGG